MAKTQKEDDNPKLSKNSKTKSAHSSNLYEDAYDNDKPISKKEKEKS